MNEENIKKIKFDTVRKKWDEDAGKWSFSIVDIVGIVTKTSNPRNYWKVFKNRLNTKQKQLVTECNQLKLEASDGKFYLTDVADVYLITEILKSLSPANALTFKAWAMSLSKPKDEKSITPPVKKFLTDISPAKKEKSYPQVTYTLANLIRKKNENETGSIEQKEEPPKKLFKKITKMRTI